MIDLGLTEAALRGEWWRLWTGHLVHWDAAHLAANAAALLVPVLAVPRKTRIEMLIWGVAVAPLLSVLVLLFGPGGEMRGASGLAVGCWIYAGISLLRSDRLLGSVLLLAIAAKLAAEAIGLLPSHAGYMTLSMLHYSAAAAGLMAAMLTRCAARFVGSDLASREKSFIGRRAPVA